MACRGRHCQGDITWLVGEDTVREILHGLYGKSLPGRYYMACRGRHCQGDITWLVGEDTVREILHGL